MTIQQGYFDYSCDVLYRASLTSMACSLGVACRRSTETVLESIRCDCGFWLSRAQGSWTGYCQRGCVKVLLPFAKEEDEKKVLQI